MASRKDKILQLLKDKNNPNEKDQFKKENRKRNNRPGCKLYSTTADMLQLFDGGKWPEFTEKLDKSFNSLLSLKSKQGDEINSQKRMSCQDGQFKEGLLYLEPKYHNLEKEQFIEQMDEINSKRKMSCGDGQFEEGLSDLEPKQKLQCTSKVTTKYNNLEEPAFLEQMDEINSQIRMSCEDGQFEEGLSDLEPKQKLQCTSKVTTKYNNLEEPAFLEQIDEINSKIRMSCEHGQFEEGLSDLEPKQNLQCTSKVATKYNNLVEPAFLEQTDEINSQIRMSCEDGQFEEGLSDHEPKQKLQCTSKVTTKYNNLEEPAFLEQRDGMKQKKRMCIDGQYEEGLSDLEPKQKLQCTSKVTTKYNNLEEPVILEQVVDEDTSLYNSSPMVELTLEELSGTPVEKLYAILDQRPQTCLSKKNLFDDIVQPGTDIVDQCFTHFNSKEDSDNDFFNEQENNFNEDNKTIKSRTHNCLYCDTLVTNFRRHLFRNHMMEEDVRAIISEKDENLKERRRKRRKMLDDLRKKGNHKFNSARGVHGEKFVLPIRRPTKSSDVFCREKFVSCVYCFGTFSRKTFYRHLKKCDKNVRAEVPSNVNQDLEVSLGRRAVLKDKSLNLITCVDDQLKRKIFDIIQKDKFGLTALNDPLISAIGLQFLSNHREKKDEYSLTKKMRDAAKLLHVCQEQIGSNKIKQFSDLMHPSQFQLVMKGVQVLSKLNEETGTVGIIGMPARLSYVIIEGAKIVLNNVIQNNNISRSAKNDIKTSIQEFLELFRNSYKYYISTNAENTRKKNAATKEVVMPDDKDIDIVMSLVITKQKTLYNKLSNNIEATTYENLCKAVICELLLFNRRRPGELVRAELFNFCNRPQNEDLTDDVLAVMTEAEKESINCYSVFLVPGKNGRTVPILFNEDTKKCIDLIISCRNKLKIPIENRLLFPRVYSQNSYDGSKILRELTQKCSLKKPSHLTATGLRHHLATKTALPGKESLTENICEHLGHTSAVHKKNYRFPIQVIQRGVVANHLKNINCSQKKIPSTVTSKSDQAMSSADPSEATAQEVGQLGKPLTSDDNEEMPANLSSDDEITSSSDEEVSKKIRKRKKWTDEEKAFVVKSFSSFIESNTTPGKSRCESLIKKNLILRGRTWQQVNAVIHNINTKKLKMPKKC